MTTKALALLACVGGMFLPARAATLFDNGAPNHLGGSDMVLSLETDDFVLSSASTLTSAQFWDFETPGGADYAGSIYWAIYSSASNFPNAILYSGTASGGGVTRLATGVSDPSSQFAEYNDTFTFGAGLSLAPGTYWLALHNGSPLSVDPNSLANFAWENTSTACKETSFNVCGRAKDLTTPGSPFLSTLTSNAFNLTGNASTSTTPEPGSIALLGAGLLGLCLVRGRSRKLFNNPGRKQ